MQILPQSPFQLITITRKHYNSRSSIGKSSNIRCSSTAETAGRYFPPINAAKRVVLVRHGQSTWNAEGRIRGSSNFLVLTTKGEVQAEISRQMFIDDSFDVCFTSPLSRSKRTAEIIWGNRDAQMIPDTDLREIDLYSFQGLLKHEGKEKFGPAFRQWQIDAPDIVIDGLYPVRELWSHARNCWDRILTHESKSVLVVAHNAVNQALVATAMGLRTEYFRVLLQSNCGVSVLDFIPRAEDKSPYICLNRLNQTPSSPTAGGASAGRKASSRIILVCHGTSENSGVVGDKPMNMLGVIQVQEAADCLGADCVPRYVDEKEMEELSVETFLTQSKHESVVDSILHTPLNGLGNGVLDPLWDQTGNAWQGLLKELPNSLEEEKVVVVVGGTLPEFDTLPELSGVWRIESTTDSCTKKPKRRVMVL